MQIDSHQHFWHYNPAEHTWMSDEMSALKQDFLPADLKPLLAANQFDGSVAVQARQSLEETHWLLQLASKNDFVLGVVGWVDLRSGDLPNQLEALSKYPKLAGVRHVVQDEPDDDFMLRPDLRCGIALLRQFNLTYDLLLYPKHLPAAIKLVEQFPGQPFVLDHMAKPRIADGLLSPWQEHIQALAKSPNVYCKLSGLVTEAKWKQWQPEDFRHYWDTVFSAFGPERLMIGSDWPVCTLSADYGQTIQLVKSYLLQFSEKEQAAVSGGNCARFYRIGSNRPSPDDLFV